MRWVIVMVLAGAACSGPTERVEPSSPAPVGPSVPTIEEGELMPERSGTSLVVAPGAITRGADAPPIVRLAAGRFAVADVEGGEHGYLVPAIRDAVARSSEGVTIAVDPSVAYETVARVVYSVGQSGASSIAFLAQRGAERGVVPIELPRLRDVAPGAIDTSAIEALLGDGAREGSASAPSAPADLLHTIEHTEPTMLTIAIGTDAITISLSGERVAPGCREVPAGEVRAGAAPTLPRTSAGHDLAALSTCLAQVRSTRPGDGSALVVPSADVAFGDVLPVIAVVRGTREHPLFPSAMLGVGAERAASCTLAPVFFGDDSLALDDAARAILEADARCIGSLGASEVTLTASTDARPSDERSLAITEAYGRVVRDALEARGVPRERIHVRALGASTATGTDADGWARDRRVELEAR